MEQRMPEQFSPVQLFSIGPRQADLMAPLLTEEAVDLLSPSVQLSERENMVTLLQKVSEV